MPKVATSLERLLIVLVACVAGGMLPTPAWAALGGEFLVFPNINSVYRDEEINLSGHHELPKDHTEPTVDFFYTEDFGHLRLIGEFFVSSSNGSHFERLQLGWRLADSARLWGGRFHNPVGYWNTQYHHGNYLETAISRPGIVSYEHDGGIMPLHEVGAGLEGDFQYGEAVVGYDLAAGLGPELNKDHGLEALNITDPEGSHDPVFTLRLRYHPVEDGPDQYGLFASLSTIPSDVLGEVDQTVVGVYGNRESPRLRLTGALFAVHHDFMRGGHSRFVNGYLQAELPLGGRWTLFARLENGWGDNDDALLNSIAAYVHERQLGGLRLELGTAQALKLEVSNSHYLGNHSEQVMLQWSAVIP